MEQVTWHKVFFLVLTFCLFSSLSFLFLQTVDESQCKRYAIYALNALMIQLILTYFIFIDSLGIL